MAMTLKCGPLYLVTPQDIPLKFSESPSSLLRDSTSQMWGWTVNPWTVTLATWGSPQRGEEGTDRQTQCALESCCI